MITSVIRAVIRWKSIAWLLVAAGVLLSAHALRTASLDAIPDISDPQIVVYVKWPRSPQLLEREVTEGTTWTPDFFDRLESTEPGVENAADEILKTIRSQRRSKKPVRL